MALPQTQKSLPELFQEIVGNLEEMVRAEFRLAKAEAKEEAVRAARPGALLGVGLVISLYGVGFLLLAAVYGLASVMDSWLAALIVGSALAITAAVLISSGVSHFRRLNPTRNKTLRSLEESAQWAKDRIK